MDLSPLQLENELVHLIPLTLAHRDALVEAAEDGQLWKIWYTSVPSSETIDSYITTALKQ